jgi:hypothetical protein
MLPALLTFYRSFFLFTGSISLFAGYMLWNSKSVTSLLLLFWMKLITNALIGFLFSTFKKEGFYFYNNLGFSAKQMLLGVLLIDVLLWLFISIPILVI